MAADIINLKRVRKAKARLAKAEAANVSRAAFGRTKVEREATVAETARANQLLDGAKLPPQAANQGSFPSTAEHDGDDDLDPGNVS